MKYTPYPYQAFAEKFVLEHNAAGLFLDMGLGKTAITLSACEKLLRDYFETSKVLVIAPLLPARETWPDELAKWDQLEGLTYSLIIGTAQERVDALHTDADFYIINRENVVWLVDYYKKKWPFDMVVIDELSSLARPSALGLFGKSENISTESSALLVRRLRTVYLISGPRFTSWTKARGLVERCRPIVTPTSRLADAGRTELSMTGT